MLVSHVGQTYMSTNNFLLSIIDHGGLHIIRGNPVKEIVMMQIEIVAWDSFQSGGWLLTGDLEVVQAGIR